MRKSILGGLVLAISLASLVGCISKNTTILDEENNMVNRSGIQDKVDSDEIPVANMSGKLVNYYETLEEINKDSEIVVKGKFIKNEYIEYEGVIFTVSQFKIDDVIKGNINRNDVIKVLQTGGIGAVKLNEMDEKSFENPEEVKEHLKNNLGKKFESTIEGIKVLKENDNAVLLLQKYYGPITQDSYVGTGDFQGRFIINEKTKSINPQSVFLKETVTLENLMNLK
ncbi:MAG: hypothetical protein ACRC30_12700 [Clostridium sp.]